MIAFIAHAGIEEVDGRLSRAVIALPCSLLSANVVSVPATDPVLKLHYNSSLATMRVLHQALARK